MAVRSAVSTGIGSNFLTSIVSYNMHGYNQGENLLKSFCSKNELDIDCIFCQEHWLTPTNLYKLKSFSTQYTFYGISAMEQTVSSSVLKGRPYGGSGILMKNQLCKNIKFHVAMERFVVIVLKETILISVYLPSLCNQADLDTITDNLSQIEVIIAQYAHCSIIFGGDMNVDLQSNLSDAQLIHAFMNRFSLELCTEVLSSNTNIVDYTYRHETLNRSSYIDYFMVSSALLKDVAEFDILDSAVNHSDHLPIFLLICLNEVNVSNDSQLHSKLGDKNHTSLRWDHADLRHYYTLSRQLCQPINDNLAAIYDDIEELMSKNCYSSANKNQCFHDLH